MLLVLVPVAALFLAGPGAVPEVEEIGTLNCPGRYQLPGELSPAVDVRWAGEESVLILRAEHGTSLHRLVDGLPVEELVLPGRHHRPSIHAQYMLAVSDNLILASDGAQTLWRKLESSLSSPDASEQVYGGFGDVDMQGDRIAILGNTEPKDWRQSPGTRVWLGKARAGKMGEFSPLLPEDSASVQERKRASNYIFAFAGSLRFLTNGDLLVFPGYRARAYLFDEMGKEKRSWDLSPLGLAGGKADRLLEADVDPHGHASSVARWGEDATTVDEVLGVDDEPAVVVKARENGDRVWRLGLLGSDSVDWYRIPVARAESGARLRGDVDKDGRVVFLVGGRRPARSTSSPGQAVLLCELP